MISSESIDVESSKKLIKIPNKLLILGSFISLTLYNYKKVFEKTSKIAKISKKNNYLLKMQFKINGALFQCTFYPSLIFVLAIKMTLIIKWGPGGNI